MQSNEIAELPFLRAEPKFYDLEIGRLKTRVRGSPAVDAKLRVFFNFMGDWKDVFECLPEELRKGVAVAERSYNNKVRNYGGFKTEEVEKGTLPSGDTFTVSKLVELKRKWWEVSKTEGFRITVSIDPEGGYKDNIELKSSEGKIEVQADVTKETVPIIAKLTEFSDNIYKPTWCYTKTRGTYTSTDAVCETALPGKD